MTASSPRLGRWLLRPLLEGGDAHALLGDLEEEFQAVLAQRGLGAARRWYLRQAVGSVRPLLAADLERPTPRQWLLAFGAVGLQVVVPLRALEALRSFILGQIPLKDGLLRSPAYLATTLGAAALCLAVASWVVGRNARATRFPAWCLGGMAWMALGLVGPHWPPLVWLISLPGLGLGTWVGSLFSGGLSEDTAVEGEAP